MAGVRQGCSEGAARAADLLLVHELESGHRRLIGPIRCGVQPERQRLPLGILLEVQVDQVLALRRIQRHELGVRSLLHREALLLLLPQQPAVESAHRLERLATHVHHRAQLHPLPQLAPIQLVAARRGGRQLGQRELREVRARHAAEGGFAPHLEARGPLRAACERPRGLAQHKAAASRQPRLAGVGLRVQVGAGGLG